MTSGAGIIKILLTAINAKYIHSSLAIQSLYTYAKDYWDQLVMLEFTINNQFDRILSEIYQHKPQIICFSCYIWNIDLTIQLSNAIKKLLPEVIIIAGGPEISYDIENNANAPIDIIVAGEGEETFLKLLNHFQKGQTTRDLDYIKGIFYQKDQQWICTPVRPFISLDKLSIAYEKLPLSLENKIIYYESTRGCPYNCQYCLSSAEKGVRYKSLDVVIKDLDRLLKQSVKQVKFVDRTFNCNKNHCMAIWSYLIEHDNQVTNFHFELSADLMDDEMMAVLKKARKGLFQFEIGVQSTNETTLGAIKRKTHLQTIFQWIRAIAELKTIHQHLDLIAGLPEESYDSFKNSFNQVYALNPDMLQLGFLKLLKGSGLRENAQRLGLVYNEKAPYEILFTPSLSYEDLLRIKDIEALVELYYNSSKFKTTLKYVISLYDSPWAFFEALSAYFNGKGLLKQLHSKQSLYQLLYDFLSGEFKEEALLFIRDLLKFDLFLDENTKNLPSWMEKTDYRKDFKQITRFYENDDHLIYYPELTKYTPAQKMRMCHIEKFRFQIPSFIEDGVILKQSTYVLFHYYAKEKNWGNCACYAISL